MLVVTDNLAGIKRDNPLVQKIYDALVVRRQKHGRTKVVNFLEDLYNLKRVQGVEVPRRLVRD